MVLTPDAVIWLVEAWPLEIRAQGTTRARYLDRAEYATGWAERAHTAPTGAMVAVRQDRRTRAGHCQHIKGLTPVA